jgi:hypothetical protein
VAGNESPLVLNPLPVTFACVIVKLALPELVSCTAWEFVLPVKTLVKVMLPGETAKLAWAPDPVTLTEVVPL